MDPQLLTTLDQHVLRIVDADELHVRRDAFVQIQQGRSSRAAEVVNVGARDGEVGDDLRDHALHLEIERHRALEHVVEHRRDLRAEVEVGDGLQAVPVDLVSHCHGLSSRRSRWMRSDASLRLPREDRRRIGATKDPVRLHEGTFIASPGRS
jgi:hypothetical protein